MTERVSSASRRVALLAWCLLATITLLQHGAAGDAAADANRNAALVLLKLQNGGGNGLITLNLGLLGLGITLSIGDAADRTLTACLQLPLLTGSCADLAAYRLRQCKQWHGQGCIRCTPTACSAVANSTYYQLQGGKAVLKPGVEAGSSGRPRKCRPGTAKPVAGNSTRCVACSGNTIASNPGQAACQPCGDDQYPNATATACLDYCQKSVCPSPVANAWALGTLWAANDFTKYRSVPGSYDVCKAAGLQQSPPVHLGIAAFDGPNAKPTNASKAATALMADCMAGCKRKPPPNELAGLYSWTGRGDFLAGGVCTAVVLEDLISNGAVVQQRGQEVLTDAASCNSDAFQLPVICAVCPPNCRACSAADNTSFGKCLQCEDGYRNSGGTCVSTASARMAGTAVDPDAAAAAAQPLPPAEQITSDSGLQLLPVVPAEAAQQLLQQVEAAVGLDAILGTALGILGVAI